MCVSDYSLSRHAFLLSRGITSLRFQSRTELDDAAPATPRQLSRQLPTTLPPQSLAIRYKAPGYGVGELVACAHEVRTWP